MNIKQLFYAALMPVVKIYWRVLQPKSFGVKVLITHPTETSKVLLVRHSYGNTSLWNIPGGGYNPKKENAEAAAKREVFEELGVKVIQLSLLGEYLTSIEGKQDTVTMYKGTIESASAIKTNPEISEIEWAESSLLSTRGNDVARVARRATEKAFIGSL
jgi:8-oxo-dGTP pyrophosphatase MutT (NUDIX family)